MKDEFLFLGGVVGLVSPGVVWLAKTLIERRLDSRALEYERELVKRLLEHGVGFTKLHERRFEAVDGVWAALAKASRALLLPSCPSSLRVDQVAQEEPNYELVKTGLFRPQVSWPHEEQPERENIYAFPRPLRHVNRHEGVEKNGSQSKRRASRSDLMSCCQGDPRVGSFRPPNLGLKSASASRQPSG